IPGAWKSLQQTPGTPARQKTDWTMQTHRLPYLKTCLSKRTDAIHGHLYANKRPYREPSSKWYVSKEEYNGTEYPPFLAGSFYVLGGSTLRRLYNASEQEPFFWLEDVFLTGFVAEKAGVNRTHESSITDEQFSP
ncbi:hypothetical protein HPB47_023123, partial [Ixodes persulcatus]